MMSDDCYRVIISRRTTIATGVPFKWQFRGYGTGGGAGVAPVGRMLVWVKFQRQSDAETQRYNGK
jgi:hypothetical protein